MINYVKYTKKISIAKEIANVCDKQCSFGQKKYKHKKVKHKKPFRSRELNPGALAPKADALSLHHRDVTKV